MAGLALAALAAAAKGAGFDPGAPAGAAPTGEHIRAFDRYELPVGPYDRDGAETLALDGEVAMRSFRIADTEATTAAVIQSYRDGLTALGFETVFACRTDECGGFDFRFGVALLPAPAMLMDTADFAQLSMKRTGERDVHVSVLASRVLGHVYVQTVSVTETGVATRVAPSPGAAAADEILTLPQDERSLRDRLLADGHVRVEGLAFEPGGARLSEASTEALDRLARLLGRNPELRVAIVGHSDNAGGLDVNIELSRTRAEAVMAALAERGVAADRMAAHGVGWLAPVATNATVAGRALNRRVELVLR